MLPTIPAFTYRHATAADRAQLQLFTNALLASGRFWRDANSLLHFQVSPDDFARVANKFAFRELLLSGDCITLTGDTDDAAFDTLWQWAVARMWVLPRLDPGKPPGKPKPIRHERYQAPSLGKVRS